MTTTAETTTHKTCVNVRILIVLLFLSMLSYPIAILFVTLWDQFVSNGETTFVLLQEFVYSFLHGSKRHFLDNVKNFLHAWMWAGLLASLVSFMLLIGHCISRKSSLGRKLFLVAVLAIFLVTFAPLFPGITGPLIATTTLLVSIWLRRVMP